MLRVTAVIVILALCIVDLGAYAKATMGHVLAVDLNHDKVLNQATIKEGHDFILVKQNPSKLSNDAVTFVTNKDGIVSSAIYSDLDNPGAFKTVFVAQVMPAGTVKILTLANLGYIKIYAAQKSQTDKEYYLVTANNSLDRIETIEMNNDLPNLRSINDAKEKVKLVTLPHPKYQPPHNLYIKYLMEKVGAMIKS